MILPKWGEGILIDNSGVEIVVEVCVESDRMILAFRNGLVLRLARVARAERGLEAEGAVW